MSNFQDKISALNILLAINATVFLFGFFFASGQMPDKTYAVFLGAFSSFYFEKGMFWTLVTTNFVHLLEIHFIFNILALYQLGKFVEMFYGGKKLFITFVLGSIGGVILSYVYYKIANESFAVVGASGGIYALIGLIIGSTFRKGRFSMDLPIDRNQFIIALLPSLIINFLPNVSWQGHLGGFIVGFILGMLFSNSISIQTNMERKLEQVLFALCTLILVVSYALLILNLIFNIVRV